MDTTYTIHPFNPDSKEPTTATDIATILDEAKKASQLLNSVIFVDVQAGCYHFGRREIIFVPKGVHLRGAGEVILITKGGITVLDGAIISNMTIKAGSDIAVVINHDGHVIDCNIYFSGNFGIKIYESENAVVKGCRIEIRTNFKERLGFGGPYLVNALQICFKNNTSIFPQVTNNYFDVKYPGPLMDTCAI